MPLYPLQIKPGIEKERPSLTSEPTWRDCDLVRFKAGLPEKMGGWTQTALGLEALTGIARSIHEWRLNTGVIVTVVATTVKLYLITDNILYDITPLRETQVLSSDPMETTNTSTTIIINDVAHGSAQGDYVTFTDATSANFVDSEVNANHEITFIDVDSYSIEVATPATGTDSTTGGSGIDAAYELSIGSTSSVFSYGFGSGQWGMETWGDARSTSTNAISLRYWSLDHFGEDLVATHESGRIYKWVAANGVGTRAVLISESPDYNDLVLVTNPDRHLIAFASAESAGDQDFMLVRWADQETTNDWTSTATNTAGFQLLSGGSKLLSAIRSQNTTLLWTDTSLHAMQYIGPPFTFGFHEIATNCGAIGKQSVIAHNSVNYWMGTSDFYIYDGVVKPLPCSLHRYVFKDLNKVQGDKVVAGLIKEFHEIIWFYPSLDSDENDRYVVYNYLQDIWYHGSLSRTAWIDSELSDYPQGINTAGTMFNHETTVNDNGAAMAPYIESSEFDIEQGDRFYFIRRCLPDMAIAAGSVNYTFKTRRYPHSTQVTDTTLSVSSTTEKLDTRIRTRQLAIRIDSDQIGDDWRMGLSRIDLRPDGRQ